MQLSIKVAAVALLAFTTQVSAHAAFMTVTGDGDSKIIGSAIGYNASTPRKAGDGITQAQLEADSTCFFSPIVRPPKSDDPKKQRSRTALASGCGSSLQTLNNFYRKHPAFKDQFNKINDDQKNTTYYQAVVRDNINWKFIAREMGKSGKIAVATANGHIDINVHMVDPDGAGPYSCGIDAVGTASLWGDSITATGTPDADGNFVLTVPIPATQKCSGKYDKTTNVCMMRCQNKLGYGGCIPFVVKS
ncbi:hypothetical protein TWF694_002927 [Orbilia ellipsospora]|uniref:Uncharacterized protein n=1 Tax=Orbilia ellipsospora TaxID=2528407 RepID=A0AAV9X088_9PEZI